jgi:hypothetical protein
MKPFGSVGIVYRKIVLVTATFYVVRKLALIHARNVEDLKVVGVWIMAELAQGATLKDLNFRSTYV